MLVYTQAVFCLEILIYRALIDISMLMVMAKRREEERVDRMDDLDEEGYICLQSRFDCLNYNAVCNYRSDIHLPIYLSHSPSHIS